MGTGVLLEGLFWFGQLVKLRHREVVVDVFAVGDSSGDACAQQPGAPP
jgi:hypothetical protein